MLGAQMKTAPEGAGNTDEGLPNPKQPERTTPMVDDQTSLYRYCDREGALIYVGVTNGFHRFTAVCTCGATSLCPDVAATGKHRQAS